MGDKEIELIEKYITPETVMLEWGSGGSTIHFSKLVKELYSIEHDFQWYNKIKKDKNNNVNITFVPSNGIYDSTIPTKDEQFEDYINYVDRINKKYDIVFIDGRARVACSKKVIPYLNENAVVFIHDFWAREPLRNGPFEWYKELESIKEGQSIVALKVK